MTDALLDLEVLTPAIRDAQQAANFGAAAERVRRSVELASRHAALLPELIGAASALGCLADEVVAARIRTATDKAYSVGEDLAQANSSEDLDAIAADYSEVTTALSRVADALANQWKLCTERDFLPLIPVGQLLSRISGAETIGRGLISLAEEAQRLSQLSPAPDQLRLQVVTLKARREELLSEMRAFTHDPEVDAFLEGVTRGQATLEFVTPGVLAWLAAKNALGAFSVRG